jgi:WD40 repeat protein
MALKAPAGSPAGLIWYNIEEKIPNPDPNLADFPTIVYSNYAVMINASGESAPATNFNNLMTGLDAAWNHRIWATYPSGDNRYLVLMAASEPGGNPIVYDTLTGETRIPLPSDEYPAGNFLDWHPDNRHFLFYASFDGPYLVDAETSEITRLALDVHLQGGAISPDGLAVAFIVDGDPSDSLWLTSVVGGDAKPVFNTGNTTYIHIGAWSPDGTRLVYYGRCREDVSEENRQQSPICIYDLSTGERNEAQIPSLSAGVISWSPDGRYIAAGGYTRNKCDQEGLIQIEREACQYDKPAADLPKQQINRGRLIYIEDTFSGEIRELVAGYAPVWSPDGSMIAFLSNRSGAEEVWLIHSDGTGLEQLTTDGGTKVWSIIWTQETER